MQSIKKNIHTALFGSFMFLQLALLGLGNHAGEGWLSEDKRELIYYNRQVLEIFGCETGSEFRTLTGGTFEGMVYKDDFNRIQDSIDDQINAEEGNGMDHVIYRIIRKDGSIRWIDDYGHFSHSEDFGDIYYVFINDITEAYESRMKNKN